MPELGAGKANLHKSLPNSIVVILCSAQHAEVLIFQQEMSAFCSSHENAFSTSGQANEHENFLD